MEASQPGTVMCTERLEVVHNGLLPAVPVLRGLSNSPASVTDVENFHNTRNPARWDDPVVI